LSGRWSIRTARETDLDRLVEIHSSAFPDPRGVETRRRLFSKNVLGDLDCLFVAERAGVVLGHAFLFHLGSWFGGRRVRVGAIASLGVAPEARGEALAKALLDELHKKAREHGDAIAMLYPFRQGFYARHDYVAVSPSHLLRLHPRAVPRFWAEPSLAPGTVRAALAGDRAGILAAYERSARRHTGWMDRPDRLWERTLLDERKKWFVLDRQEVVVGYVCWTAHQVEAHAATRLDVHDLVADDEPARRRLLALVGAQRDQVDEVALQVEAGDPIDRALVDVDLEQRGTQRVEHALGTIVAGPMLRLLDVRQAVEARGYGADGALDIAVDGGPPQGIQVGDGQGRLGAARGGPLLRVDRVALGALLYGGLSASSAARLGWLSADSPGTLRIADDLFAHPPFFSLDAF
jgi:predicted acetyltransferase